MQQCLTRGDLVAVEMEGIGTLHNTVAGMRCPATPDEA
jgi:2-keto-4-pentenoate hydratase/2-oxohepta-3-ene-1,7-dioic acid hydratase in catechol pathway